MMMNQMKVPGPVVVLLIGDLLMVALYLSNKLIGAPFEWLTAFVDLGGETNLPTWYSSAQFLLIALSVTFYTYATFDKRRPVSWAWIFIAGLYFLMSLDEVAQIHERLGDLTDQLLPGGDRAESRLPHTGLWIIIIGPPVFLVMFGAFLYLWRELAEQRAVIVKFLVGLVLFFTAAVGVEAMANLKPQHAAYILQICAEEGGELLATTLMVWAAYELVIGQRILRFQRLAQR